MRILWLDNRKQKSVLYVGQAYYNSWYLSRALRKLGWTADLLNWDLNPRSQIYYHGEDFRIDYQSKSDVKKFFYFYFNSLSKYQVFHFANKGGLQFGEPMRVAIKNYLGQEGFEIHFLKALGKKIVYSNNGCLDGVSQTRFSKWGPESPCSTCRWQQDPSVCSDDGNLAWGAFRNSVADFQCFMGVNRVEYNDYFTVHAVPEFYCLNPDIWHPKIEIPPKYQLPELPLSAVRLYHAVGNRIDRTKEDGANIKSSHIYIPLIKKLICEGMNLDLIEPVNVPNNDVRYLQVQADIFLEMLTYGWFGANAREAMMLAKPVICFLRPEWLESARKEMPEYINELPIVNATPETIELILRDLISNKEKRLQIGRRSREFAIKWHSADAGARRFNKIYSELLKSKE